MINNEVQSFLLGVVVGYLTMLGLIVLVRYIVWDLIEIVSTKLKKI